MPKFTVHAVQVITQEVVFEVETPTPELARAAIECGPDSVELVDACDEEYHRNIVTKVELSEP